MKTPLRLLSALSGLLTLLPPLRAADGPPPAREERNGMRVVAAPDRERRVIVQREERKELEKEAVTFLGVEATPVPAAMSAQLGLPRDTGLLVGHVVPKSAAADVFKEHDILLRLDDQILIDPRQLSVLIRNHQEGDEVTVTYLRGGQKSSVKVKLGRREVPKSATFEWRTPDGGSVGPGGERRFEMRVGGAAGGESRPEWDGVLSLLQRARPAPDGPPGFVPPGARIRIEGGGAPGVRAMRIHAGNSTLVFRDEAGSLELTMKDGVKTLVAKGPKDEAVFSGPVTTPDERRALPDELRARLEKLEGMHDVTFRTDGEFRAEETRVVQPRGIAFPVPDTLRTPPSPRPIL
jgi:hypothetical protein